MSTSDRTSASLRLRHVSEGDIQTQLSDRTKLFAIRARAKLSHFLGGFFLFQRNNCFNQELKSGTLILQQRYTHQFIRHHGIW